MSTKCVTQSSLLSGLGWVYLRRDPAIDLRDGKRKVGVFIAFTPSLPCHSSSSGLILCGHTGPLCHRPNPHRTMVTLPPTFPIHAEVSL